MIIIKPFIHSFIQHASTKQLVHQTQAAHAGSTSFAVLSEASGLRHRSAVSSVGSDRGSTNTLQCNEPSLGKTDSLKLNMKNVVVAPIGVRPGTSFLVPELLHPYRTRLGTWSHMLFTGNFTKSSKSQMSYYWHHTQRRKLRTREQGHLPKDHRARVGSPESIMSDERRGQLEEASLARSWSWGIAEHLRRAGLVPGAFDFASPSCPPYNTAGWELCTTLFWSGNGSRKKT